MKTGIFSVRELLMDDILHYKLPLQGDPDEAIFALEEIVTSFIEKDKTVQFYIGQSLDLDEVKISHNCDAVVNLYNSRNGSEVRLLEFELMKKFYRHRKNRDRKAESGEEISLDSMNYLYLALWFK